MASLTNQTIASTYPLLLKISDTGVNASLKAVEDGDGTSSALMISTEGIAVETSGLQVHINTGSPYHGVQIETSTSGGWARSFNFGKQTDNTRLPGYGGYGDGETLTYNYIGQAYNDCNIRVRKDSQVNFINTDLSITGTNKLYFGATSSTSTDTVGDTYITEGSANKLKVYAGGVNCATFEDDSIELGTSQLSLTSDSGAEIYFSGTGNAANIIGEQSMGLRAGYGSSDSSHVITFGTAGVDGQIVMRSGNLRFAQASYIEPEATAHDAVGLGLTIAGGNPTAGGANDIGGGSLTIAGGQGKGTAAGGNIIFKIAETGGSSTSSLNSLATVMTLSGGTSGDTFGKVDIGASQLALTNDSATEIYFSSTSTANITSEGNIIMKAAAGKTLSLGASDQNDSLTIDVYEDVSITGGNLTVAGTVSGTGGSFSTDMATPTMKFTQGSDGKIECIQVDNATTGKNVQIHAGHTLIGGTSDLTGGDMDFYAGQGKGTGHGGHFKFWVAPAAGVSSATKNTSVEALLIDQDKNITMYNNLGLAVDSTFIALGVHGEVQLQHVHDDGIEIRCTTGEVDAVNQLLLLKGEVGGTPAAGIGTGLGFATETTLGNVEVGATIDAVPTVLTAGSEDFTLSFKLMKSGGAAAEKFAIDKDGVLELVNNIHIMPTASTVDGTGITFQKVAGAEAAYLKISSQSTNDAFIQYAAGGGVEWTGGLDVSDSDAFTLGTGTAPGSSNVLKLTTGGDMEITGKILEGRTQIKIKATDFYSNDDVTSVAYGTIEDDGSNYGIRGSVAGTNTLYAYIDIPLGYTATKVRINGSDTANQIEVYTLDLDDGTIGSEISNSGLTIGDDTDLSSNHVGADDKILLIKVITSANDDIVYGGYVTIEKT